MEESICGRSTAWLPNLCGSAQGLEEEIEILITGAGIGSVLLILPFLGEEDDGAQNKSMRQVPPAESSPAATGAAPRRLAVFSGVDSPPLIK